MSRFDYVQYDEKAIDQQQYARGLCTMLEDFILGELGTYGVTENMKHAIKSLEETYMWIGKTVRDVQFLRNGEITIQEEKGNS